MIDVLADQVSRMKQNLESTGALLDWIEVYLPVEYEDELNTLNANQKFFHQDPISPQDSKIPISPR